MKPTGTLVLRQYCDMLYLIALVAGKTVVLYISLMVLYKHFQTKTTRKINIQEKNPVFTLIGPYDDTKLAVKDIYNQLINIKDFKFLINPKVCQEFTAGLLLVIIVPSKPNNYKKRSIIRNTWGQVKDFAKVLFLLGQTNLTAVKHSVQEESNVYGDIVLGNFVDAYKNMTYKHLMGLKWIAHHCSTARYILKVDDDALINSWELQRFLVRELSPWGTKGLLLCCINENMPVIRDPKSPLRKWRVLKEEFAEEYYPPYCSGSVVIYSQDVLVKILESTQRLRYFWIDDAHITGVAVQNTGIKHTDFGHWYMRHERFAKLRKSSGTFERRFIMGPIGLNTDALVGIWEKITDLYS